MEDLDALIGEHDAFLNGREHLGEYDANAAAILVLARTTQRFLRLLRRTLAA